MFQWLDCDQPYFRRTKSFVALLAVGLTLNSCTSVEEKKPISAAVAKSPSQEPRAASVPRGTPLSRSEIAALAGLFNENPLVGGQTPPRSHKWVNENVSMFLQFDRPNPSEATTLRYIG